MSVTLRSREALEDVKEAYKLFRRGDVIDFHLTWVLCAALLGATEGALFNFDMSRNRRDSIVGDIARDVWNKYENDPERKMSGTIRNEILHRYELHYEGEDVYEHGIYEPGIYEAREYRRKAFKGDHPIEVIERVIRWWENLLTEIETRAA